MRNEGAGVGDIPKHAGDTLQCKTLILCLCQLFTPAAFYSYVMRTLEQSVRQQLKAWGTGVQGVQQGRVIAGQGKSDPLYNRQVTEIKAGFPGIAETL